MDNDKAQHQNLFFVLFNITVSVLYDIPPKLQATFT